MTEAEQKVRAVWKQVDINDGPYALVVYRHDPFHALGTGATEDAAWSAALAYTEERLEEVRQLREEIAFIGMFPRQVNAMILNARNWTGSDKHCAEAAIYEARRNRILSRLEAILADLTRGMKPEAVREGMKEVGRG